MTCKHIHREQVAVACAFAARTMLIASVALLPCVASAASGQTTWYVDDDNCPGPGDGSIGNPFCLIQDAIDAAAVDDEVVVTSGSYNEAINLSGKAITVRSTDPFNPAVVAVTILDGTGLNTSLITCDSGEGANTIIDGLTITGGDFVNFGGGMYNEGSSPTVANCTFSGHTSFAGGGMYNYNSSSPTVTQCVFSGNSAANFGGGMYNANGSNPTVTDCTFSDNAVSSSGAAGGGMFNAASSPTLTNCTFSGNTTRRPGVGGGLGNVGDSNPLVVDCTFTDNIADDGGSVGAMGGAMYNSASNPIVLNCMFSGNSTGYAGDGGAICNVEDSSPVFADCTFSKNAAGPRGDIYAQGGGMYNSTSHPLVVNCLFRENYANDDGGGMYNDDSSPTLIDCTFEGNVADLGGGVHNTNNSSPSMIHCALGENVAESAGGGIYNDGGSPTMTGCLFSANSAFFGGAMYNSASSPIVTNSTLSGNASITLGGGMYNASASSPTLANCVLWGDSPDEIYDGGASTPTVTYSNVQGGYTGDGNIDADPLFVDPFGRKDEWFDNNYRLAPTSPCIDAADNTAAPPDEFDLDDDGDTTEPIPFDLDGEPRFVDRPDTPDTGVPCCNLPVVDMGAYEFQVAACLGDFNGDGMVDAADLASLLGFWGTPVVDLNGDGTTDAADLAILLGNWGPCP